MGRRGPNAQKTSASLTKKPHYSGERSPPPRGMTPAGKRIWVEIVADFPPKYHQQKNFRLLELYCETVANWCKARTQLAKEGLTITNENTGVVKKNPLLNIIDSEAAKMIQLASKLGLTVPPDRPDGNISFAAPEVTQEKQERIAYGKLKDREAGLEGVELSLFNKLREKYG